MSERPAKQIHAVGGGRKHRREGRFFDWQSSDPAQYDGQNGLATELMTYKENLTDLLPREGDFVLIKGREVIGVYTDPEEALAAAHNRFPSQKVLIKKIVAKEPIHSTGGVVS